MGIEPTLSAWKAEVLPLNYTRLRSTASRARPPYFFLVEGEGFEPSKAEPADLQSAPFGRSGTPPKIKQSILLHLPCNVKVDWSYSVYLSIT
jgi:hypothetical protein